MDEKKVLLRKKFLELRKELFKNFSIEDEKKLVENFFSLEQVQKAKIILSYMSKDFETPTKNLNLEILKQNKILCLPKTDFENKHLIVKKVDSLKDLEVGRFGVLEPSSSAEDIEVSKIVVGVVPGLAFDKSGYRLGYGLGFYDRFLKDKKIFKIGLCFDGQIVDSLPVEQHDVALDCIVSEKRILRIQK